MNYKLNTKVFNLDDVLVTYTYGKVMSCYDQLVDVRKNLIHEQACFLDELYANEEDDNCDEIRKECEYSIDFIEKQLNYLDKNIQVFRDAMVIQENSIIKVKPFGGVVCKVCYN